MGIYIFRVTCTGCSFEGFAHKGPSSSNYQLSDGTEAPVRQAPAWCARCADVVDAELLPDLDALERELGELELGGPAHEAFMKDAAGLADPAIILERTLDSLRAEVKWRRTRTSPPRCLVCGATQVTYLPRELASETVRMRHPSCDGALKFQFHARGVAAHRVYSVEGERLEP